MPSQGETSSPAFMSKCKLCEYHIALDDEKDIMSFGGARASLMSFRSEVEQTLKQSSSILHSISRRDIIFFRILLR